MKKNTIAIILLLASLNTSFFAQAGNNFNKDTDNINKMFPAAPTSNNLMKFEEVPVSYYTGIPDISIPLFNIPTSSPNVNLNVQLKYHPLSAKPDDKAGETGLGWSLLAGGTITRTVRGGVPDEKIESTFMSSPPSVKYGVYKHDTNTTYKMMYDINGFNISEYAFYAGIGKFDTEYDLYQYNFMGYAGRFIILKDQNGIFHVEKLDRNNLKITSTHTASGEIENINITDEKGIQYVFKGMESSSKYISTIKTGMIKTTSDISTNVGGGQYFTSYHLDRVNDQNQNVLLSFNYGQSSVVEYYDPETRTTRRPKNIILDYRTVVDSFNPDPQMPGVLEVQTVANTAQTKLLTSITVVDKGTINFTYEKGRNDSNYLNPTELYKLKSVQSNIIGQGSNQFIDKYIFDYGYSNSYISKAVGPPVNLKKMLLQRITKSGTSGNINEYTINYNSFNKTLEKDSWGYYKAYDPEDITQDVINSITYPTKGKVLFDFGENIYSHSASFSSTMTPITGEWVNQDNSFDFSDLIAFNPTVKAEFFTINTPQKVKLHLDLMDLIYSNWKFDIYKKNPDNTYSPSLASLAMSWQSCISNSGSHCADSNPGTDGPTTEYKLETINLQPGTYYVSLSGSYGLTHRPISYNLTASTKENYFNSYLTKKGGGLRINSIKYFDTPVSVKPAKEFVYDYRDINDPQKSSGALVFPAPVLKYEEYISYFHYDSHTGDAISYSCDSDTTTDFNIVPVDKTQGSDVGYQYVTVKQILKGNNNTIMDNGKTVYKFRSPIDFPNSEIMSSVMPIVPISNEDYLRGQILFEKKYDANEKILSEVNNEYTELKFRKLEGIKAKDNYYNLINPDLYKYSTYEYFKMYIPDKQLTSPYKYYANYGATLPTEKRETSYFYKNGVQSSVVSTTNTAYNTEDYPINVTQSILGGDTYISGYKYAKEKANQRLIAANMLAIPLETESKKNGQVLSKTETKYDNVANLFPSSVISSDLQNSTPYTEVTYEKYDVKGNLQQYKTKDGTSVSIVWGYNNTQPIAKIEGITYDALVQAAGSQLSAAIAASDTDASAAAGGNEDTLLSKLNDLRMGINGFGPITTYTYDPLIGVRSITQPSEVQELYLYDTANRLKEIKQKEVSATNVVSYKTVKEFEYHYKN